MLIGIRFFAKKSIKQLWKAIETDIRNFYSPKVTPLYALQEAEKDYLSIIFEIRELNAFQDFMNSNPTLRNAIKRTRGIPLHLPYYFDVPTGLPSDLQRFSVFLRIDPSHYKSVCEKIVHRKYKKSIFLTFFCFSFGDDDVILSLLARDMQSAMKFVEEKIASMTGVISSSVSQVERSESLTTKKKLDQHKEMFAFSSRDINAERKRYEIEKANMTLIMRVYTSNEIEVLWKSMQKVLPLFESSDFCPLYLSQQEASDYITLVSEIRNFESINELFFQGLPDMINIRKWRSYPLINPLYFLMPKDLTDNLERFLITMMVEPERYQEVYSKIHSLKCPKNIHLNYLCYSLGPDDIMVSILADGRDRAETFAEKMIGTIKGVDSYSLSNQLRTLRIASKKKWLAHRNKHLSSFDKQHRDELDKNFDWTEGEDYLGELSAPFIRDLHQED